jgi:type IV secretion system protein VirB9
MHQSGHRHVHHHHRARASVPIRRVATANADSTQEPEAAGFVNGMQSYNYSEGLIYKVYTAPGRITDIALQPGEALGAVASGDTVRWVIGNTDSGNGADKRTHILIKPFAAGLSTNLFITTDRRSYHLTVNSTNGPAMSALSWNYPQDQLIALKRAAEQADAQAPVASSVVVDQLHFNYVVSGDEPFWRPLRAFDDGRQTFIEFPAAIATGEAPPLFIVGRQGEAQLVNYRVKGHFYIVDRLFDAAELRLGTRHQDIVRIARIPTDGHRRS